MKILAVYLHGRHVGALEQDESGRLAFGYDPSWLSDADARPLSQSLPLEPRRFDHRETRPFFAGLLPDASARERVARALGTSARNDFSLLDQLGGECAGAVMMLPAEQPFTAAEGYQTLSPTELLALVRELPRRPLLAGSHGVRLSLAGAQDKLALARLEQGGFALPLGGAPSTHLLKTPIHDLEDTVTNEAFCLELAARLGLESARAEILELGGDQSLLVERYDRASAADGRIRRLHQEDFCQALGVVPENKYEADGGPSLGACFELLTRASSSPARDRLRLLDAVVFDLLIGNHDAHGKNFSLLYREGTTVLAPRYDVLSTAVYPTLAERLAMKIGGEYAAEKIYLRHFERLAKSVGLASRATLRRVGALALRLENEVRELRGLWAAAGKDRPVLDAICALVERRCGRLRGG